MALLKQDNSHLPDWRTRRHEEHKRLGQYLFPPTKFLIQLHLERVFGFTQFTEGSAS